MSVGAGSQSVGSGQGRTVQLSVAQHDGGPSVQNVATHIAQFQGPHLFAGVVDHVLLSAHRQGGLHSVGDGGASEDLEVSHFSKPQTGPGLKRSLHEPLLHESHGQDGFSADLMGVEKGQGVYRERLLKK